MNKYPLHASRNNEIPTRDITPDQNENLKTAGNTISDASKVAVRALQSLQTGEIDHVQEAYETSGHMGD